MAEEMSLDSILSEDKPETREPAAEPAKPAAEPVAPAAEPKEPAVERPQSKRKEWSDKEQDAQGRVRDPATGQFVAKEEPKAEPKAEPDKPAAEPVKLAPAAAAPQEFTEKEKAFLRAAQEERGKRQELERKIAAGEYAKTQPVASTEPAKTFWEDPEGALTKHRQELEQVGLNTRLNTAEMIARSQHPDFDEKVAIFRDILGKAGPNAGVIAREWLASPDPAMFAYNLGKNHMELQQIGGLDALRVKIQKETEAKVRSQVETEMKEKAEALAKERAALPGSLSDARSVGANRPVWGGVPSLDSVLKG